MVNRIFYEEIVECYILDDVTNTVPFCSISGMANENLKRGQVMKISNDGSYRYLSKPASLHHSILFQCLNCIILF